MSEENEWDHRSNFNDYDGDHASSVTEAVNQRKKGKRVDRHEEAHILSDVEPTRANDEVDLTWG